MKLQFLIILAFLFQVSFSQEPVDTLDNELHTYKVDKDAKFAVFQIVQYSGLIPNFNIVEDKEISNALAYIKNRKRYIKYNPDFMKRVNDSTKTDWAAISVLAHEIGHHLLGHTLKNTGSNPGDELAADRYSGFILHQMGATLEQALECIEIEGSMHGSKTHPPKSARIEAITDGWEEAEKLKNKKLDYQDAEAGNVEEKFKYRCVLSGDENTYYVNEKNQMVWYDNYANPIVLGVLKDSEDENYKWDYLYDKTLYRIDRGGDIWLITTYGSSLKVGELSDLEGKK